MKEKILELFSSKDYKPLEVNQIYQKLALSDADDFTNLVKALNELEDDFLIYHNNKNKFAKLADLKLIIGEIDVKEAGFGFVNVIEPAESLDSVEDIYINQTNRHTALSGDLVLVKYFKGKIRFEGEVIKIIKRKYQKVIGIVKKYQKKYLIESLDSKKVIRLNLPQRFLGNATLNDVVEAEITKYYENANSLLLPIGEGKILRVYGDYDEPGMDINSLILSKGISVDFPNEVLAEAEQVSDEVKKEQYSDRISRIDKQILTIDGDDAKDLDDAINIERLENGNYHLGVYIADVSEYVKLNSKLDIEAFSRATSIYLPNRVIPMLPHLLSNGICSLNEGVIRLVMAVEMEIDLDGKVVNSTVFKSVIKSSARLTYQIVNEIVENDNPQYLEQYQTLVPMLKTGVELAKILYKMRIKRGAFDFDTIESKVVLDDNLKAIDVAIRERKTSEKMIEEFMLIANEAVAQTLSWLDVPTIYRVHDQPKDDKITNFIEYAKHLGYKINNRTPKALATSLQNIFLSTKDINDTSSKVIHTMLLRSMAKAKYQTNNIGHYGLASECYTHFTSPIRRYPDLVVHRLLKQFLLNDELIEHDALSYFSKYVEDSSVISSEKERIAEMLEREANDMKKAEYMQSQIGQRFLGSISSVTNWGTYVVLDNSVEGLVRFEHLPGDYYLVNEKAGVVQGKRTGMTFGIGDRVEVEVLGANKKLHQIDLKIIKKIMRTI